MLKSAFAAIVALGLSLAAPAGAEVVERHADGFTLRFVADREASAGDVVLAIENIGGWWDSAHTYSGDAANMTMALEPGGCFCEALPDGTIFEHGRVRVLDDDHLVLDAPLGPLKDRATRAELTFSWPDAGTGVAVTMTFVVEGPGLGAFAAPVDQVMAGQFGRLVDHISAGSGE